MKLSIEKCIALQNGLSALDQFFDKVIEDGKNSKKVVQSRYDLSKKVRIENGMRLTLLESPIKQYQNIRTELLKKYGKPDDDEFKVPADKTMEFNKENQEALDVEVELELPEMKYDDLKLDDNPIPGVVLAYLAPILIE